MRTPFTIMLVDDDLDDQLIFKTVINDINSEVKLTCFADAEQILNVLDSNNKPDCIFLDLNLPLMHGFDVLRHLKSSPDLDSIPVIIYSTSSRDSDRMKSFDLGAFDYLSKPTTYSELKEKINGLLSSEKFSYSTAQAE